MSVTSIMGSDLLPLNLSQTIFSSFGVFMGAVIQANIFGELVIILANMDKYLRIFDYKIVRYNTTMIYINLPFNLQQEIRHMLTMA